MKEKSKKKRIDIFGTIAFLFYFMTCMGSLIFIFFGFNLFNTGYHNIDIATNFMNTEDHMNLFVAKEGINHTFEIYETSLTSEDHIPLVTVYKLGLIYIKRGILVVMGSAFIFGFSFCLLVFRGGD